MKAVKPYTNMALPQKKKKKSLRLRKGKTARDGLVGGD